MDKNEGYIDVGEFSKRLGCSEEAVYKRIRDKKIQYVERFKGIRKIKMIPISELEKFQNE